MKSNVLSLKWSPILENYFTFSILRASTSAKKGPICFSPTTFMIVPSAVNEASRTSRVVSFAVCNIHESMHA